MPPEASTAAPPEEISQLAQVRVPMEEAADAFATRDATGRTPIVVVPSQPHRIRNQLVLLALVAIAAGIVVWLVFDNGAFGAAAIVIGLLLLAFGVYRSFYVLVPEGVAALLMRRGQFVRAIGSGMHVVPPYIAVSHLVTRREIPFEVPVVDAPTQDNVRAALDALITFTITEPYRFVYSISAADFDQVLQASCQHAMRAMIRGIPWDRVNDLAGREADKLRTALSASAESYGVTIVKVNIVAARPPAEFFRSEEARHLAILQRSEHTEHQALAERRQASEDALARQRAQARAEREREEAEARRKVAEVDLEAQIARLARLEEALSKYPHAAEWEWQGAQLDVARALAGNTRAVLQVGNATEIARALTMGDLMRGSTDQRAPADGDAGGAPPESA
jgi:regulator of protease activity HflC (stomatin/prohibitin superfamily)